MSIYKSKLNEEKIKNILQEEYQIIAKKIEKNRKRNSKYIYNFC